MSDGKGKVYRWTNIKPDKIGMWACKLRTGFQILLIRDERQLRGLEKEEWCYLGPVPEILPPLRSVIKRLWIQSGVFFPLHNRWLIDGVDPEPIGTEEAPWHKTFTTKEFFYEESELFPPEKEPSTDEPSITPVGENSHPASPEFPVTDLGYDTLNISDVF